MRPLALIEHRQDKGVGLSRQSFSSGRQIIQLLLYEKNTVKNVLKFLPESLIRIKQLNLDSDQLLRESY